MRVTLNHNNVETLPALATGRVDYFDTRQPGFGLRVSQAGVRSWQVMYRHQGQLRRAIIGHWPAMSLTDARKEARRLVTTSEAGKDPAREETKSAAALTVEDLTNLYIAQHAIPNKKPYSVKTDRQIFKSKILPALGHLRVADVRRADIRLMMDAFVASGKLVMGNRVHALLSGIFSFAVGRELCEYNAVTAVKRPLRREQSRERTLSNDELRRLWSALADVHPRKAAIYRLLLLTATRKTETLGMAWSELDLDAGLWVIPGERTKNGKTHRMPLVTSAVSLLRELNKQNLGPWVFPGSKGYHLTDPRDTTAAVRSRAELEDFHLHDLRRTVASKLAELGVQRTVIGKILNHSDGSVINVYDRHSYQPEMRSALLRWESELARIVTGQPRRGEVIELPARAS